mgnify:CR=1 FL=1
MNEIALRGIFFLLWFFIEYMVFTIINPVKAPSREPKKSFEM